MKKRGEQRKRISFAPRALPDICAKIQSDHNNSLGICTEMSQKELVKKRTEYDFSVPKMRFAYGNDTKIKRRHLKANVKKRNRRATRQ